MYNIVFSVFLLGAIKTHRKRFGAPFEVLLQPPDLGVCHLDFSFPLLTECFFFLFVLDWRPGLDFQRVDFWD
jgi:hypothetical protein